MRYAVQMGDIWIVQGSEYFRFTLDARHPGDAVSERFGQHLQRHVALQLGIPRAMHSPIPPAPISATIS